MNLITIKRLDAYSRKHSAASSSLNHWKSVTKCANWSNFVETRLTFSHADQVKVASGRTVTVFNIKANAFRLITAIHYNKRRVYILDFLSHADYDKDRWKLRL